jgi:release factor glutamine methyltransferase
MRKAAGVLKHSANPLRDAELLLMHALGISRTAVIATPDKELTADELSRFETVVGARATGQPVQHILGVQEFYGLEFEVSPAVLIPRPETEHLVEAVLNRVEHGQLLQIADVGTGSGAIAIALATQLPQARVWASDMSPEALAVAARNAERHGVSRRIEFARADLLAGCLAGAIDVVASNPPYIAEDERGTLAIEVREFEPAAALFAGATGYEVYERLLPQAQNSLKPGGLLALEMGFGQSKRMREMLREWSSVEVLPDLAGVPRVALARKG